MAWHSFRLLKADNAGPINSVFPAQQTGAVFPALAPAILFAGHHKLKNLLVIIDYNKIQSLGFTRDILDLEPFVDKWSSFKWNVIEVDGHNMDEIHNAIDEKNDKPTVIIAHTVKGKGVSFMEDTVLWHYRTPKGEELKEAIIEINNQSIN